MIIPQRPGIVIRSPPEKDQSLPIRDDTEYKSLVGPDKKTTSFQASSDYAFTLYTNMSKCRYSSELLDIVEKSGMVFEVKDVSRMTSIPSWLKGTPVVEFKGEGYCGDLAFNFVDCLSTHFKNIKTPEPQNEEPLVKQFKNNGDDSEGCSFSKAFSPPSDCGEDDSKYDGSEDLQKVMERMRR